MAVTGISSGFVKSRFINIACRYKRIRVRIFGVGPKILMAGGVSFLLIHFFKKYREISLPFFPSLGKWAQWLGIILIFIGIYFGLSAIIIVKKAFEKHQLAQNGVYSISRNPMYAAFIIFIVPGISFVINDLLYLLVSVTMFIVFKKQIRIEEEYLLKEFGQNFIEYMKRVPQLFLQ